MGPWLFSLLLCASIAFAGGIVEDYTGRVSARWRLLRLYAVFSGNGRPAR